MRIKTARGRIIDTDEIKKSGTVIVDTRTSTNKSSGYTPSMPEEEKPSKPSKKSPVNKKASTDKTSEDVADEIMKELGGKD